MLKNGLFSNIEPIVANVPKTSVHSYNSSFSEDIFVPTLGQPSTTNENIGQSGYSPPVRSPIQTSSPVDVQQSVLNPNPVGQCTDNMGGTLQIMLKRILM